MRCCTKCGYKVMLYGCTALSLDGSGSEFCFSRDSLSGPRLAAGRRRAHEFSREDAYARDTSFYSEMAGPSATRISGVSTSSARGPLGAHNPHSTPLRVGQRRNTRGSTCPRCRRRCGGGKTRANVDVAEG